MRLRVSGRSTLLCRRPGTGIALAGHVFWPANGAGVRHLAFPPCSAPTACSNEGPLCCGGVKTSPLRCSFLWPPMPTEPLVASLPTSLSSVSTVMLPRWICRLSLAKTLCDRRRFQVQTCLRRFSLGLGRDAVSCCAQDARL